MSNEHFDFKQFSIKQDRCAMKVGTDAVLLGAWAANTMHDAQGTMHVLDIGTGSGVIALMLAQQFAKAQITGIDIDETAIRQAQANFAKSPWSERLSAQCISLQEFTLHPTPLHPYSLITSNPPYFRSSLACPDPTRHQARHTDTLSYDELIRCSAVLLAPNGVLALVLPGEAQEDILTLAAREGLYPWRLTHVVTSPNKPAKRILIALTKEKREMEEDTLVLAHDHPMFKAFYL